MEMYYVLPMFLIFLFKIKIYHNNQMIFYTSNLLSVFYELN